jgi:hypothetical protein
VRCAVGGLGDAVETIAVYDGGAEEEDAREQVQTLGRDADLKSLGGAEPSIAGAGPTLRGRFCGRDV